MFKCINQTFHQNKKCSWDKTGEEILVLDYAISAEKYPKIVTQEKEKFKESQTVVFQNYVAFLRRFDVVFHMFGFINKTFHENKKCS